MKRVQTEKNLLRLSSIGAAMVLVIFLVKNQELLTAVAASIIAFGFTLLVVIVLSPALDLFRERYVKLGRLSALITTPLVAITPTSDDIGMIICVTIGCFIIVLATLVGVLNSRWPSL